jgi:hypothetical protein
MWEGSFFSLKRPILLRGDLEERILVEISLTLELMNLVMFWVRYC